MKTITAVIYFLISLAVLLAVPAEVAALQISGGPKLYILFPRVDSVRLVTDDTSGINWNLVRQGHYGTADLHAKENEAWLLYTPQSELHVTDTLVVGVSGEQGSSAQKAIYVEMYTNEYQYNGEKLLDRIRMDFYHSVSGQYAETVDKAGNQSGIPCYLWPASHMLRALKNGYRVNPAKYRNVLRNYALGLDGYRTDTGGKPGYSAYPGDPVRFYDDNGLLIIQFAEVAELLDNDAILDRAIIAYDFNNSDRDTYYGLPQLESEKGQGMFYSMAVNQTGLGAALLSTMTGDTGYLQDARNYYLQLNNPDVLIKDPDFGLFHQYTFFQEGTWSFTGTVNGITRNGMGFRAYQTTHVIQIALELYRITREGSYLLQAREMMDNCIAYFYRQSDGLHENAFWGGDDMIDALVDFYNVTADGYYLDIAKRIIGRLVAYGKDPAGYYPSDYNDAYGAWNLDRRTANPSSFMLMGQAAAASGILRVAHADLSGPQDPVTTGIRSQTEDQFLVYPTILDPGQSIHVRSFRSAALPLSIAFFDVMGSKIADYTAQDIPSGNELLIPCHDLSRGMYLLTITQGENRITRKILISD